MGLGANQVPGTSNQRKTNPYMCLTLHLNPWSFLAHTHFSHKENGGREARSSKPRLKTEVVQQSQGSRRAVL